MGIDYGKAYLADDLTLNYRGNQITTISDAVSVQASPIIGFVMPSVGTNGRVPVAYNYNGAMTHNYYKKSSGLTISKHCKKLGEIYRVSCLR